MPTPKATQAVEVTVADEPREGRELAACPNPWCHPSPILGPTFIWKTAEAALVECHSCGLQGPIFSPVIRNDDGEQVGVQDAEALAIAAWNRRPSPVAESTPSIRDAVADGEGGEDDTKAFCDQWERPFQSGEPSRAGVARDADAPKELFGAVGLALFRADLAGMNAPDSIAEIGNAAWAFLRTANTGRAEVLEEAAKRAHGMLRWRLKGHELRETLPDRIRDDVLSLKRRALSSPPVTTAPDGPSEDDELYLAQEVAWSTPTDATAVEAEREACAKLVEEWNGATADGNTFYIAAAIRARTKES